MEQYVKVMLISWDIAEKYVMKWQEKDQSDKEYNDSNKYESVNIKRFSEYKKCKIAT